MIALILKWAFVLGLIAFVVFGLSAEKVRKPLFGTINKFKWQILTITALFVIILSISLIGT